MTLWIPDTTIKKNQPNKQTNKQNKTKTNKKTKTKTKTKTKQKLKMIYTLLSPSIGLTNLAKTYHVHYHLSQPDMAGLYTALEYLKLDFLNSGNVVLVVPNQKRHNTILLYKGVL